MRKGIKIISVRDVDAGDVRAIASKWPMLMVLLAFYCERFVLILKCFNWRILISN